MQNGQKGERCLIRYIRQRSCGRFGIRWKEFAAAALLLLCFWSVFYPDLALPADVCQKADGSALDAEDYEKILNTRKGELRITFCFSEQKQGKRTGTAKTPDTEKYREENEVGSTGIQGEARRSI